MVSSTEEWSQLPASHAIYASPSPPDASGWHSLPLSCVQWGVCDPLTELQGSCGTAEAGGVQVSYALKIAIVPTTSLCRSYTWPWQVTQSRTGVGILEESGRFISLSILCMQSHMVYDAQVPKPMYSPTNAFAKKRNAKSTVILHSTRPLTCRLHTPHSRYQSLPSRQAP